MLGEMLQLEDTHADVYQSFMDKTFSWICKLYEVKVST